METIKVLYIIKLKQYCMKKENM